MRCKFRLHVFERNVDDILMGGLLQVVQHAMRMCVWWARGGGDAVALAWSLRRAAPRLLLDDADPAVSTYFISLIIRQILIFE